MSRRRCCCGLSQPCIGSDCCATSGENCGIDTADYVVDLGTVVCKCWTYGFVVTEWDGICPTQCDEIGSPLEDIQSPLWEFYVDKCAAGEFEQHQVWTCSTPSAPCIVLGADIPFSWPQGTITASFGMDLIANPILDCSVGFAAPSPTVPFTYTGFTGAANAAANLCYQHPYLTVDAPDAVTVGASFRPCQPHPCNTWVPDEFSGSEPMCTDCSGAWDIITVAYVVRNEQLLKAHSFTFDPYCSEEGVGGCYTYDRWTALVYYVRKPVCVEEGARAILGQYTFACAILNIPGTQVWWEPTINNPGFWGYLGRRYEPANQCVWDFPYDDPCMGRNVKLCERIGYGWEFPEYVTVGYA